MMTDMYETKLEVLIKQHTDEAYHFYVKGISSHERSALGRVEGIKEALDLYRDLKVK